MLSFLRGEGEVYAQVVARAGDYAAQWTVNGLPGLERRVLRTLPLRLRTRAALRTARGLVSATYPGSRAIVRMRKETVSIDLRGSLFCEVREASVQPLCGFYAAAISRILQLFAVPGEAQMDACRAAGGGQVCSMSVDHPAGHGRGVGGGVTGTMMRVFAAATASVVLTLGVADTPAQGTPAQSPASPASSSSPSRTLSAKPG